MPRTAACLLAVSFVLSLAAPAMGAEEEQRARRRDGGGGRAAAPAPRTQRPPALRAPAARPQQIGRAS